jgi:hypothetical protein
MPLYSGTSADTFAKDVWLPGFNGELENGKGTLLGLFMKEGRQAEYEAEGRRAFVKLRIGDSLGSGAMTQGGDYPTPGDIVAAEAQLELAHLGHAVSWTTEEIAFLDSGAAAADAIVMEKADQGVNSMGRYIERQAWNDGSGIIANIASSAGSTITLDATTTDQYDRDRYIWLDDANRARYDVVNGTTGAQQVTGFTVTDINETTNVVTCSATMTAATAAGVLVQSGNWANGGVFRSLEYKGIKAMVDDSNTYMGINRATAGNGFWKSPVVANGGVLRNLTEDLIHTLLNRMARRADSAKQPRGDDFIAFANHGTWTAYHQIMSPALRYTVGQAPDIGWGDPLPMLGINLYRDVHCPKSSIYVLHKPSIGFVKAKHALPGDQGLLTWQKQPGTGSIFFIGTAASGRGHSSQYFSYLEGFVGMMTKRPRNHGVLRDLTETAV